MKFTEITTTSAEADLELKAQYVLGGLYAGALDVIRDHLSGDPRVISPAAILAMLDVIEEKACDVASARTTAELIAMAPNA